MNLEESCVKRLPDRAGLETTKPNVGYSRSCSEDRADWDPAAAHNQAVLCEDENELSSPNCIKFARSINVNRAARTS